MTNHCIILCRGAIEALPPVLSLASLLPDTGETVRVIASTCHEKTRTYLAARGVEVITVGEPVSYSRNPLRKIQSWLFFRRAVFAKLKQFNGDQLLWLASADTALALGRKIARRPFILQLNELYDNFPVYKWFLRFFARRARCVVVPEHCRAGLIKSWYNLDRIPNVIPNKPSYHPHTPGMKITDERAARIITDLGETAKLVLYQGHIQSDRDIRPVARAVHELGGDWRFVAMGPDWDFFDQVKAVCPGAQHIPFIPAPYHLEVTSRALVGVICYEGKILNEIFCAPNKVWEYCGFGLPLLCHDLTSLRYQVGETGAGLCVDFTDLPKIKECLTTLAEKHESFSKCALRLYKQLDIPSLISMVMERARR